MKIRAAILTVSDRSSKGERDDLSGPALTKLCQSENWELLESRIIPDELDQIISQLKLWSDSGKLDLILTTGGTGFSPRDITPEATKMVIEKEAPGLAEAMRHFSAQVHPHAYLSRGTSGIRKQTLIINLPGSPKGAVDNLKIIAKLIPHAIELLQNCKNAEIHHSKLLQS
jgi:molybdopterin adenylyltransferase